MKATLISVFAAVGSMALTSDALAHHSFSAEFSRDLPIEVTGVVTKVEWMNPHARFYVSSKTDAGETVEWDFELTTPNLLMRRGWTRTSLKPGDTVSVTGWRARNNALVGNANRVTLANGKQLFTGTAGADPNAD